MPFVEERLLEVGLETKGLIEIDQCVIEIAMILQRVAEIVPRLSISWMRIGYLAIYINRLRQAIQSLEDGTLCDKRIRKLWRKLQGLLDGLQCFFIAS